MTIALGLSRRVLHSVAVLIGVTILVFVVTHMVGDPVSVMLPLNATPEQYDALRHEFGLDSSLGVQFVHYFGSILHGDFGLSYWQKRPALQLAIDHVLPTLELAATTLTLGAVVGVPAGFLAAIRPDGLLDRVLSALSIVSLSVAYFWVSLMLILVFAVELHWLPTSGHSLRGIVLPTVAASLYPFGHLVQISRAAMLEELARPYVVTARAKGLSTRETVLSHAARNALIPVVTMAGFEFGRMMAGTLVVIEIVFNWPGIGYLTYQALIQRDFPLIQTCILVIGVLVVATNLVVDLLYSVIDPRVRA
jgi:peptide/nickel transport system permease protein